MHLRLQWYGDQCLVSSWRIYILIESVSRMKIDVQFINGLCRQRMCVWASDHSAATLSKQTSFGVSSACPVWDLTSDARSVSLCATFCRLGRSARTSIATIPCQKLEGEKKNVFKAKSVNGEGEDLFKVEAVKEEKG